MTIRPLREWSVLRVLLVCVGWILLWIAAVAGWLFVSIVGSVPPGTGRGGISAVSVGVSEVAVWLLFAPIPAVLIVWCIARFRSKASW